VHDPLSAGRRLAARAVVWQAAATALVALAFLARDASSALAALAGGAAVVAGMLVSARIALAGGVQPAGTAIGRLLFGLIAKWVVVLVVLVLSLARWGLPPLPLLAGLLAATLAYVLANFSSR